ncbi:hypothetical protein [Actinoplanes utahensis]|uniref:Uncharacterized protein n=1 Tax=Actinoplanes utahensis TaxID=1869 RepID=A0A0A6UDD7_ACTUT|nr:hypothetical protein [Actinoplanes utahensis]KHD72279.1 hypothetical protein MB27_41230 [Actinoplanes utahensis]GIF35566.1 hypothetical protein Aut01nite_85520 [Actinoplanes utahensis]
MRSRTVLWSVSIVAGLAACCWGGRFLGTATLGAELSMPPRWRIPEVPAGATVVEDTRSCGSGGCGWSLTLQPAAGQTAEELAREMGVAEWRNEPPTLTDPAFVSVGSHIRAGQVVVYVGYR